MTDDLVKRLRSSFSANNKERMPAEVFRDYERERDEAADRIEQLEAALQRINNRLNDEDSWLAQSIDCRNIAEAALGENKDGA